MNHQADEFELVMSTRHPRSSGYGESSAPPLRPTVITWLNSVMREVWAEGKTSKRGPFYTNSLVVLSAYATARISNENVGYINV